MGWFRTTKESSKDNAKDISSDGKEKSDNIFIHSSVEQMQVESPADPSSMLAQDSWNSAKLHRVKGPREVLSI